MRRGDTAVVVSDEVIVSLEDDLRVVHPQEIDERVR